MGNLKKQTIRAMLLSALAGGWTWYRNKKYPLAEGFRLVNKFFVPEQAASIPLITMGNHTMRRMRKPEIPPAVRKRMLVIPNDAKEQLRVTVYEPEQASGVLPCLVYIHGGGFFFEEAWYLHEICTRYAMEANCRVMFVHYRTSDIAPFPAPFNDCCRALQYVYDNADMLQIDKTRIAIGGDSAGAALAGACTLWARDEAHIPLCFQLLIYPVIDSRMETESMKKYPDCPFWNSRLNKRMWEIYLRNGDKGTPHYASPILSENFAGLPDAYVEVEEFDCLHDEGAAYAKILREAGCTVQLEDVKGTFHGYDMYENHPLVKEMLAKRCAALKKALWDKEV
ncbi:MAG: alpha/beta hydrolase [Peptococcaceae bacterium]|nr:alpha/beta hydrolase [Peptococcaceae bacterium]